MHQATQCLGPSHLWTPMDPTPHLQAPSICCLPQALAWEEGGVLGREGLGLILLTLWSLLLVLQGSV